MIIKFKKQLKLYTNMNFSNKICNLLKIMSNKYLKVFSQNVLKINDKPQQFFDIFVQETIIKFQEIS